MQDRESRRKDRDADRRRDRDDRDARDTRDLRRKKGSREVARACQRDDDSGRGQSRPRKEARKESK
eukprot:6330137-Alexandrium_andersonii.AAC.1